MDTSKEYVIMRIKAKDDLDWGQAAIGLHRVIIYENDKYTICSDENANFFVLHSEYGLFQLERQDQLQEMMKIDYQLVWHKNGKVEFWFTPENSRMEVVDSVEQGLLLAIMELKFNKVWDGKEWIKKND